MTSSGAKIEHRDLPLSSSHDTPETLKIGYGG